MATALSSPPSERIRRVDVLAYVFGLMGLVYVGEFAVAVLAASPTAYEAGMAALGGFALLGTVQMYRDPDFLRNGAEPAPAYLYVLPVVSTGAALVLVVGWVATVA
ncbi:hypothetical protein C475_16988 [Halosimplex carlsbadense 2-9-1]|uniref:Uncharacterized protein n=1 Tax=Halosimplex carlsbadense 2-9-1 TaxID=797114 RepID=M0CHX1_9EURY|nr:hypothetical protein [Halosimplex carlsbadense]ELZ22228.1 hypothetical protein C475_16988 [Halosimplex carlsbadense 2-9-1]